MKIPLSAQTIAFGSLVLIGCNGVTPLKSLDAMALAPAAPDYVTLQITNYTPSDGNTYKDIFVSNFSVKPLNGKLYYSTARDGLTDSFKSSNQSRFGFSLQNPYTNLFTFSDLFLYNAGISASQKSLLYCDMNHQGNTGQDGFTYNDARRSPSVSTFLGFRDCEKLYMGLNVNGFDQAGNGIPDYLKLRCGLNPLSTVASTLSIANDMSAKDKCKRNIPIDESINSTSNQLFAYKYDVKTQGLGLLSSPSMIFTVSNIPIYNGGLDNFIAIYIVETNNETNAEVLSSAYVILPSGVKGRTLSAQYWWNPSSSNPQTNVSRTSQEIVFQ